MKHYGENHNRGIRKTVRAGIFAGALLLLFFGSRRIEDTAGREQEELLRRAVNRAVVSCYAVEGRYPESLTYLEENYGVRVDPEKYLILYEVFADNVKPRFRVKRIGE